MISIRKEFGRYLRDTEVFSEYHSVNPTKAQAKAGTRVRFNRGYNGNDTSGRLDAEVLDGPLKGFVCYCLASEVEVISPLEQLAETAD